MPMASARCSSAELPRITCMVESVIAPVLVLELVLTLA